VDIVFLQNPFDHLARDSDVEGMSDGWDPGTACEPLLRCRRERRIANNGAELPGLPLQQSGLVLLTVCPKSHCSTLSPCPPAHYLDLKSCWPPALPAAFHRWVQRRGGRRVHGLGALRPLHAHLRPELRPLLPAVRTRLIDRGCVCVCIIAFVSVGGWGRRGAGGRGGAQAQARSWLRCAPAVEGQQWGALSGAV
jgi:hypothetical protein